MENAIKQIAEKLGMSEEQASGIAEHLQSQGHDVGAIAQQGNLAETIHGLLGDRAQEFLGHIPGIGGMLSGMLGGAPAEAAPEPEPETSSQV